jgi:D-alanine transaminase
MPDIAYVNGRFMPLAEACVSVEDRGFQFGDGVYEVIAVYAGRPFLLDRHLRRLESSLRAIHMAHDLRANPLEPLLAEGIRRCGHSDAVAYVQITRGAAARSHIIPPGLTPTVVITFRRLTPLPDDYRRRGAALMTTRDDRWGRCWIKAITLLPNILARNEAIANGFDDALFVTESGEVRECTSANVFRIRGDVIFTPPRDESVLHGVTQDFLKDCAGGAGLTMREERFDVAALRSADEVFMSSTSVEVLAVTRLDEQTIGRGPGPATLRLHAEFCRRARG